jgi:hypothetical protein
VKISPYAPLEHPLAHQFQRAVESLTAALAPESHRQYRGAARYFLIYLGEDHPAVCSLDQLRRDPHILGWYDALAEPAFGTGRLHLPPPSSAVHSAGTRLDRAASGVGTSDPSRRRPAGSSTPTPSPDGTAGSTNPERTASAQ